MTAFLLIYLLKVTFCTSLFFSLYWLVFRRRKFFQLHRFYLLYSTILAFFIPFLQWSDESKVVERLTTTPILGDVVTPIKVGTSHAFYYVATPLQASQDGLSLSWGQVLLVIYVLGVTFFLVRLASRMIKIRRIIRGSAQVEIDDQLLLMHPDMPTSSFFSNLFWRGEGERVANRWIIAHELVHARQWHTLDLLVLEVSRALQWFNPLLTIMSRELSLIHEYIADRHVVGHHANRQAYIQLLAETSTAPTAPAAVHTFGSQLPQRIRMLAQRTDGLGALVPYTLLVPLVLGLGILVSSSGWSALPGMQQIGDTVQSLDDKTLIISLRDRDELGNGGVDDDQYYLQWGDYRVALEANQQDHFIAGPHEHRKTLFLDKEQVKILARDPFEWGKGRTPIDLSADDWSSLSWMKSVQGNLGKRPVQRFRSMPAQPNEDFTAFLANAKHGSTVHLIARIGGQTLHVEIWLIDEASITSYILWRNQKFELSTKWSMNLLSKRIQLIRPTDMAAMLRSGLTEVHIPNRPPLNATQIKYFQMDGASKPVSREYLLQEIKRHGAIRFPIVAMVDHGTHPYFAIFDDEERPHVIFDTWNEVFAERFMTLDFDWSVREELEFAWGPLQLRPPRSPGYPYPHQYISTFDGQVLHDNSAKTESALDMLSSRPRWVKDGKRIKPIRIVLQYIDHEDLPFTCDLQYDNQGRLQHTACMDRIRQRLKPGDFLVVKNVSSNDEYFLPPIGQIRVN